MRCPFRARSVPVACSFRACRVARSAPVACLFRARRTPVRRTDWFRCV